MVAGSRRPQMQTDIIDTQPPSRAERASDRDSQGQAKVTDSPVQGHEIAGYEDAGDVGRDVRCKLAMAEQEVSAVKRHLAESRRENDDLLKAVAYLRSKLDVTTTGAAAGQDHISSAPSNEVRCSNHIEPTTASPDATNDDDVDVDKDAVLSQNSSSELDYRRLKEELQTATQARRQLERELSTARRDMDAMLETLRRKERQFTDERKLLEKKNKELSDVFDLFAERSGLAQRRHKCIAARKGQLHDAMMSCRICDDVSTQTDDVMDSIVHDGDDVQVLRRRVEQLELMNRDKDETIKRHVEMLECNDVIVTGMTRSVTSLEASLSASRDLLADKERALAATVKELDCKTEECERTGQLHDVSVDKLRQIESKLISAEQSLSEKERQLEQCARQAVQLKTDNEDQRRSLATQASQLEENKLHLNKNRSDMKRLGHELERKTKVTDELTAELEATRERVKKYEVERRKLESDVGQLSRHYRAVFKQLFNVSRQAAVVPSNTQTLPPPLVTGRKLFDVHVKHEKSSSSSNVSTGYGPKNDQSSPQQQHQQQRTSTAVRRHRQTGSAAATVSDDVTTAASDSDADTSLLSQQTTDDDSLCTDCVYDAIQEMVGAVMSPAVGEVVRRRDRNTMSAAPAAFRRSRSMSELDSVAASNDDDVIVFHEQLVEPIQLTMFTPHLATTVIPSPTIVEPLVMSSLPPSCDVTRRRLHRRLNGGQGTLSASASRDHSPTQRYPPPPPNMIINPLHRRSLSADRSPSAAQYNSALQRLVKRLSDVIDVEDDVIKSGGHVMVTSSADSRHDSKADHSRGSAGGHDQHRIAGADDVMTSAVARKASSQTEIALSSLSSASPTSSSSAVSGASTARHSRLSKWTATLALFRKKTRRTDSNQSTTSTADGPTTTTTITVSTRPLLQQCSSLSSGDVTCASSQVHSNLSRSQPIHYTASVSAPASSTSTVSEPRTASKLARIIDPLKLRRRPNSSSVDLDATSTSTRSDKTTRRPVTVLTSSNTGSSSASRSSGRRSRYSLTSAYMQGSL